MFGMQHQLGVRYLPNNQKNRSFRNRENLQYCSGEKWKVQQFSSPLSLALGVFYFPSEPNIPEGPEYEKISTLYLCTGGRFTNSTQKD